MKLESADISSLRNILNIADMIDIEALVIADGRVSGINKDKTALILSEQNIPQLAEGSKLGLSRLKLLKQRLDLFSTDAELEINIKENAKQEATQLELKGTNSAVQFRATPVASIKYPKNVNDDVVREVIIQKDQAKLILDAGKVMGAANIAFSFKSKKNEVVVEFTDATQDTFTISLIDPYTTIGDSDTNVCYFVFNTFAPLLRTAIGQNDSVAVRICGSSALILVNGHDIRVIAQTDA